MYHAIINSNEFLLLECANIILMSAMTDGSWISIGKSFNLTVNTTEKEFVDFYSDAMKQLKDKHYTVLDFTFLMSRIIQ
jgi:hypothetical protein